MNTVCHAILELQQAKGSKAKHAVLSKYKNNASFETLLYYACHPRLTYKLSEATIEKEWPEIRGWFDEDETIFGWCHYLSTRPSLTDDEVAAVVTWLNDRPDSERDLYRAVLTKTLRLGVTHKSINKAIPGLFPEWEVQQAYPIEKHPLKDGDWFAVTQKLNGVRCTFYRGQLIARSGEPFEGLDHIANDLKPYSELVFDGELTLKDKGNLSDNEAFRTATGIINSDGDKTSICFTIFDVLPADEFDSGKSKHPYSTRRMALDRLRIETENVHVLPTLYKGRNQSVIDELLEQMVAEDKEGLMINLDVPYKCKRHSGILKVKRFYTMDLPIVRVEEGTGKYAGLMGNLVVDYKGNEVGVGTGFCDGERELFWRNREQVVGMLVEVKYKEISANKKTGAESLQFPVYVQLRPDKDDVSYG